METLTGHIDRYRYYDENSGYSVIVLEDRETVVGNFPKFSEGENVTFSGEWVVHPKFGKQFKASSFSIEYPSSEAGITKFLASGLIKGIGESIAKRIVRKFGQSTFEVMDGKLERLLEVDGIGKKKLEDIREGWRKQKEIKDVIMALQEHGISTAYALKIYKIYGKEAPAKLKENPYQLVRDVWGIGFKTADEIAKKFGFSDNHPARIRSGVVYLLMEMTRNGHVYLPEHELITNCSQLLNFELSQSDPVLSDLENESEIVIQDERVYLSDLYYAERSIEKNIEEISAIPSSLKAAKSKMLGTRNAMFSADQLRAINLSLEHKFLIITGGPGTGKTTPLNGIIDLFRHSDKKIMLAAPTGRAAKRMADVIGLEAKNIHRLLEYNPKEDAFGKNKFNKLDEGLMIIDEMSMLDTYLMYHLITAINENSTTIFVGDSDQLPSIGPGNILRDLIDSGVIPTVELKEIFRQAEESRIVLNAHRINRGEIPDLANVQNSDFVFLNENDNANIPEKILQLCSVEIPERLGFNFLDDIQILSPMYRGNTGVNVINSLMQNEVNKNLIVYSAGNRQFKLFDKVMQLRNNYNKGVFNGDIGIITSVDKNKNLLNISYNGRTVEYEFIELDEITLAYAVTVHKSQGSEYPCIVMPVTTSHYIMLQRNLLYTAITRASKLLILIGTKQAVAMAVNNNRVKGRYTSLFKLADA